MIQVLPILDRLQNSFDPVADADIARLEADLQVTFPDEYRRFLLAFNGGHWKHNVFCRVSGAHHWIDNEILLEYSLGIIPDSRFMNLDIRWKWDVYGGRLRDDLVPIMRSLADPILMATSPEEHGKIYIWDHTREHEQDNLFWLADGFEEFLRSLYTVEDDEFHVEKLPIFQSVERGLEGETQAYLADGGNVECRNAKGQTL